MALGFSASAYSYVACGTGVRVTNLARGTVLAWVYRTTGTGFQAILGKRTGAWNTAYLGGPVFFNKTPTPTRLSFTRNRATTALATDTGDNFLLTNAWQFVAATWDANGVDADQHLYGGTLTAHVREAPTYTTRTVGAGALLDDTASALWLGNLASDGGATSYKGLIAVAGIWNRPLTLGELREQQFAPQVTPGCVGFWRLGGPQGTSVQRDLSGYGGHGVVSGATATALDVPLARERLPRRWFYGPQAGIPSRSLYVQVNKPTTGQSAGSGTPTRQTGTRLGGALTLSGLLQALQTAQQFFQDLAGSLTASGGLRRAVGRGLTGSLTATGGLLRRVGTQIAGALTGSGSVARLTAYRRTLVGNLTGGGGLRRQIALRLTGSSSGSGTVGTIKARLLALAGSLTPAGGVVRATAKRVLGQMTGAGAVGRQIGKRVAGVSTLAGALTALRNATTYLQSLAGTLTGVGGLKRQAGKLAAGQVTGSGALSRTLALVRTVSGSLTATGNQLRQTAKQAAGNLTLSGVVGAIRTKLVTLTGSLTASGAVRKQLGLVLSGQIGATGALLRQTARRLSGAITGSGWLARARLVGLALAGSLTASGGLRRAVGKGLTGSLTGSGQTLRHIATTVSGVLTGIGGLLSGLLQRYKTHVTAADSRVTDVQLSVGLVTVATLATAQQTWARVADAVANGLTLGEARLTVATVADSVVG